MAGGVLLLVLATPVVHIVMGLKYMPSVPVLQFMSMIPFVCGINNISGTQAMLNFGMQRDFARIVVFSGSLCFMALFPLAFWFGASGAAASALLFELVQAVIQGIVLQKNGIQLLSLRITEK